MNKIHFSKSRTNLPGNKKAYTRGFVPTTVDTLDDLISIANRYSISPPKYKGGHRAASNILAGSNIVLIDCDEEGQAEAVESRIRHYDYIKVPSASNLTFNYKWHYIIPTQESLSVFPAAMRWQVEQFFQQVGITDDMIDVTGSYDIARQFAPASIKMSAEEADELSESNETDLQAPIAKAPEELCNSAAKSVAVNINGVTVSELPPGHLWFKGKAITYADAITAVEEAYRTRENDDDKISVSGFGCPHDNHNHVGDRTRGYGVAFMGRDGNVVVKCTGNECKDQPFLIVNEFIPITKLTIPSKKITVKPELEPIRPDKFSEMVAERLKYLSPSYIITDEMRKGYEQFGAMFNWICKANQGDDEPITIVTPASTGSAKSVSAKLYLANIALQGFSGLLVVAEVDDAIQAAKEINSIAGEHIAGVYYKVSDNNPDNDLRVEIDDLPNVLIISHAMFISRSNTGKDVDKLKEFQAEQRDCIIVDERINLLKSASFGTREVDELVALLIRSDSRKPRETAEVLENFNEIIFSQENGSYELDEESKTNFQLLRKNLLELAADIRDNNYSFTSRLRGKKTNILQERINMVSLLDRIAFVINGRFLHTREGKNITLSRGENLVKVFGSIAILDATSNINPQYTYHIRNLNDIKLLDRIAVRKYGNATLNICNAKALPQSKTGLLIKPESEDYLQNVIDNYISIIGSILKPEDTLLVITYKDMVPLLRDSCPFNNVEFIYYGSSDARGSNKYSSFNKAMAIGWFRKPKHYYNNIVASITDWNDYAPTCGSKQSDATYLEQMLIVDDIAQFFNRVRCRVATTTDGDCAKTELYLFTGGRGAMSEIIEKSLTEEMTGLNVKSWHPAITPTFKKKRTKIEERAELLIQWMCDKSCRYDAVSINDILDYFGWKRSTLNSIINPKRKVKDNYFTMMCEEEGIVRYKEGRTTFFKLPSMDSFIPSLNR